MKDICNVDWLDVKNTAIPLNFWMHTPLYFTAVTSLFLIDESLCIAGHNTEDQLLTIHINQPSSYLLLLFCTGMDVTLAAWATNHQGSLQVES